MPVLLIVIERQTRLGAIAARVVSAKPENLSGDAKFLLLTR